MGFRIYLSPPDVSTVERDLLMEAFDSNWIAPVGPHVDAFEDEMADRLGAGRAVALSSGTAALHLALLLAGVEPGDRVVTGTLTFAATANAVRYVGAEPVFIDAEASSWNLDPDLLAEELADSAEQSRLPTAIITVDLYGQCCDYDRILPLAAEYGIPVIEDAAEAVGATYGGRHAGTFGSLGVLSFNGNKIMTTSGGGMLLTDDEQVAERAQFLATQARDPGPHYEHSSVGYNYRLSNLLAAVGRGQLIRLDEMIARRREINLAYREQLGGQPGVGFQPLDLGEPNCWLTCITIDPEVAEVTKDEIRRHLVDGGIEARPVWKPMHLQPVFASCEVRGGTVAAELFEKGLCLPSGSSLRDDERDEVITQIRSVMTGS